MKHLIHVAYLIGALALGACDHAQVNDGLTCEVREYLEQALILENSSNRTRLPPSGTNFSAFHMNVNPWLIKGFIRPQKTNGRLEEQPIDKFKDLNSKTSFLVVFAPKNFNHEKLLSKYFEKRYRLIDVNKKCPIFVGRRNGSFVLATFRSKRSLEGKNIARECDILASLAYFGLPDDKLSQFEDFVEEDMLPHIFRYKTGKISAYLSDFKGCDSSHNSAAIAHMKSLAESGDPDAQASLGLIYALNEVVEPDDVEAVKWFKKASAQGHADSQFNLGVSYQYGSGVTENIIKSYAWISLAASQSHHDAKIVKNELERKMTKSEILEAQNFMASCYKNEYKNCD